MNPVDLRVYLKAAKRARAKTKPELRIKDEICSQALLAKRMGINEMRVSKWIDSFIPLGYQEQIEYLTNGALVADPTHDRTGDPEIAGMKRALAHLKAQELNVSAITRPEYAKVYAHFQSQPKIASICNVSVNVVKGWAQRGMPAEQYHKCCAYAGKIL